MKGKQFTISAILVAILAVLAIYVWPTRYMYTHTRVESGVELVTRIDRFSGEAEWLMPNQGWMLMKPKPQNPYDNLYQDQLRQSVPTTPNPKPAPTQNDFDKLYATPSPKPSSGN